jgi:hypothetical protein
MNAGTRYGLFVSIPLLVLLILAPQPLGASAAFALIAAQLAVGAAIVWRRTGLKYAAASMVTGGAGCALAAYLFAAGVDLWALSPASAAALLLLVGSPVLFVVEERANPEKWRAWREFMASKSVADVLRGRHIPHLR